MESSSSQFYNDTCNICQMPECYGSCTNENSFFVSGPAAEAEARMGTNNYVYDPIPNADPSFNYYNQTAYTEVEDKPLMNYSYPGWTYPINQYYSTVPSPDQFNQQMYAQSFTTSPSSVSSISINSPYLATSSSIPSPPYETKSPSSLHSSSVQSSILSSLLSTPSTSSSSTSIITPPLHNTQTKKRKQAVTCHSNSKCANCGTRETSLWRRSDSGEVECNACNLYFAKRGHKRPMHMVKNVILKRNRKNKE